MKNKVIKEEIKMSGEKMVRERETEINRNAIGHRAAWMGLIYDEAVKAGIKKCFWTILV